MQSKLSVLQVIPNLNVSGAEQGCIDVANYLVENNYDSYVLTTAGTKIKEVEKNGTKVLLGPVDSKNPFVIFKNIFLIINSIKKYNIKIILCNLTFHGPLIIIFGLRKLFLKNI